MTAASPLLFIDAGVLIAAARGPKDDAWTALLALGQPSVRFASSDFVRLEVMPKAIYNRKVGEVAFYQYYFDHVSEWVPISAALLEAAQAAANEAGLSAVDAIHVACAHAAGADALITTESPTKPLHRTKLVPILSIHSSA